jgi:hypothetical protein
MKRIISVLMLIGIFLIVVTAFGAETVAIAKDSTLDPDSMVNYLDPTNAPAAAVAEHRGLLGLTEWGLPGIGGSAAGGMGDNPDSMLYVLDPTNAPSERIATGQKKIVPENRESIIHFLSPVGSMD